MTVLFLLFFSTLFTMLLLLGVSFSDSQRRSEQRIQKAKRPNLSEEIVVYRCIYSSLIFFSCKKVRTSINFCICKGCFLNSRTFEGKTSKQTQKWSKWTCFVVGNLGLSRFRDFEYISLSRSWNCPYVVWISTGEKIRYQILAKIFTKLSN